MTDDLKTASEKMNICEQLNSEHHKERKVYPLICFLSSKAQEMFTGGSSSTNLLLVYKH